MSFMGQSFPRGSMPYLQCRMPRQNGYEVVDRLAERLDETIALVLGMTDEPLRGQAGEHRHHDERVRAVEERGGLRHQRGAVPIMLLDLRGVHGQILWTAVSKMSVS